MTRARHLLAALAMVVLTGCASTTPGDPFESYNRSMYDFNTALDNAVVKPTARAYKNYVPLAFRSITYNFFSNIDDVLTGLNNLLQGKPASFANDWTRVLLNTTFGFFGIADPATEMGWTRNNEDLGQTLGVWGVPTGPYLVLPLFGPSSIRDATGLVTEIVVDPTNLVIDGTARQLGAAGLRVVDGRARLLGATNILQGAALDEYSFVRDAYLQRRRSLIYDGDPPPLDVPADDPEEPAPGRAPD